MGALLDGVYDGDVTIRELLEHGDFGLGTFNGLDGEMLVLDGVCYQLRGDGSARPAEPDQRTPFAVVTWFAADRSFVSQYAHLCAGTHDYRTGDYPLIRSPILAPIRRREIAMAGEPWSHFTWTRGASRWASHQR